MKEKRFVKLLRDRLEDIPNAFTIKLAAGYQVPGLPDVTALVRGHVMFIECKTRLMPARDTTPLVKQKGPYTAIQIHTLRLMHDAGAHAFGLMHVQAEKSSENVIIRMTPEIIQIATQNEWTYRDFSPEEKFLWHNPNVEALLTFLLGADNNE